MGAQMYYLRGDFDVSTFASYLAAADLETTLQCRDWTCDAFTVFAPTNQAFRNLPSAMLDDLMKPENKAQLVDILTYHMLPVHVPSSMQNFSKDFKTLEGKDLKFVNSGKGRVVLHSDNAVANVIKADILADNGVMHVIDTVLLPTAPEPVPTPSPVPT